MSVQFNHRLAQRTVHPMLVLFASLFLIISLFWAHPSSATTIVPLGLEQVVEQSDLIFEGTVIDLQVEATGVDIKTTKVKDHRAPRQLSKTPQGDQEQSAPTAPYAQPEAPVGLGVEGGRMLFTRVTMLVDQDIGGRLSASTVTFKVAGGTDGETEVSVAGMPRFELDQRYVVFLRHDYTRDAAPIVGVNQGFFKIVPDANGEEQLLTEGGDIVVAIEDNELVVRQNPANVRATDLPPEPAPVPNAGSDVRVQSSPQVSRYFNSNEAPMAIADFANTISVIKEGQK